jgi:hypothetical protein
VSGDRVILFGARSDGFESGAYSWVCKGVGLNGGVIPRSKCLGSVGVHMVDGMHRNAVGEVRRS